MSNFTPRQGLVLFANKRENDKQPVMRGILTVTDMLQPGEYEVSLWGETSAKGNKFWKGPFKPKQEREAKPIASEPPPFDDDIPF